MAQAKYTVLTPDLPTAPGMVAQAVHEYLINGPIKCDAAVIVQGQPNDAVIAYAEDMPEVDSHFKQLGTYTAEASGAEVVVVVKEGKAGVQTWMMRNKNYVAPTSTHTELTAPQPSSADTHNPAA